MMVLVVNGMYGHGSPKREEPGLTQSSPRLRTKACPANLWWFLALPAPPFLFICDGVDELGRPFEGLSKPTGELCLFLGVPHWSL